MQLVVFNFDVEDKKVLVAYPYNCMVACQTCANLCPTGAIGFPDLSYIKMMAKNKIVKKAFEIICHLLEEDNLSERETKTTPEDE